MQEVYGLNDRNSLTDKLIRSLFGYQTYLHYELNHISLISFSEQ